jgi:hypothetical protein
MARDRWFRGFARQSLEVACEGTAHHVVWRSGKLVVVDHDVPRELALAALGGSAPRCIEILLTWRRLHRRGELAPLGDLESMFGAPQAWRGSAAALGGGASDAAALPLPLLRLAALAAIVRAERRWGDTSLPNEDRRRLEHFLAARAREAVEASIRPLRYARPQFRVTVSCAVGEAGADPSVDFVGSPGHRLNCRLPLTWIVRVWARDAAVVDGTAVLAMQPSVGPGAQSVLALSWEPAGWYGLRPLHVSGVVRRDPTGSWHFVGDTQSRETPWLAEAR